MYVTLTSDVEDLITTESDDMVIQMANIILEEGARATFCVVGEKARLWRSRGRTDVVDTLARHDIGYHSNYHSVHPTVIEYLTDKQWDDGVDEVLNRESSGVAAVSDLFSLMPSCWGGPGNTWGPQVNEAMQRLGIWSIVYAQTRVPNGDLHRFCGSLCFPIGLSARDGEYQDTTTAERNRTALQHDLMRLRDSGCQWCEVYIGHPTRVLHEEFWDGVNFTNGSSPARSEWVAPRRKPAKELARALDSLRLTVRLLVSTPGIEIRTIRWMNDLCMELEGQSLSEVERLEMVPVITENVNAMANWVILPQGIDVGRIRSLTVERIPTLKRILI